MNDLIDKLSVCGILADIYPTDGEKVVGVERIDKAYEAVLALPSAQPDISEYSDKLWRNAYERGKRDAQPEIIRCKDCKWGDWYTSVEGKRYCYCMETDNGGRTEDDFCSKAERREER